MKHAIKLLQMNKKVMADNIKRQRKICNSQWLKGADKDSKKSKKQADKLLEFYRDCFTQLHNAIVILKNQDNE